MPTNIGELRSNPEFTEAIIRRLLAAAPKIGLSSVSNIALLSISVWFNIVSLDTIRKY
jgi:hypothetical protein